MGLKEDLDQAKADLKAAETAKAVAEKERDDAEEAQSAALARAEEAEKVALAAKKTSEGKGIDPEKDKGPFTPITYYSIAANGHYPVVAFDKDGKPVGPPRDFYFHGHLLTLIRRADVEALESHTGYAGHPDNRQVMFMRENMIDKPSLEAAHNIGRGRYVEGALTVGALPKGEKEK